MATFKTAQLKIGDRFANVAGTLVSLEYHATKRNYTLTIERNGEQYKLNASRNRNWVLFNR